MTREEALDELNVIYERLSHPEDCEQGVYSFRDGDYLEALDMAIKALEQEPCVGSDECKEVIKAYFDGQADTLEWIPIKTRPMTEEEKEHYRGLGWNDIFLDTTYDCELPEDGQTVLITTKYGEVQTDTFYDDGDCAQFETYSDDDDVLAWMPLPECYKED